MQRYPAVSGSSKGRISRRLRISTRECSQRAASALEEKSRLRWKYFSEVFLNSPDDPESLRSLVYCEGQRVTGFLGTVTRPMLWKGDRIRARISTQFIVDPASRGLAGLELLRAFFSGPQDLSIADESNRHSRTIWEALGGVTSLVHSMQWLCPLRPFRMGLWGLSKTAPPGPRLAAIGSPIGGCLDVLVFEAPREPVSAGNAAG